MVHAPTKGVPKTIAATANGSVDYTILPIAAGYQVNEVHLGIVFLAAMQLGYMTPPVGLNLFIASYRFEKPIMHVYSATFPFLIILMLSVLVITFWPDLSLLLVPD